MKKLLVVVGVLFSLLVLAPTVRADVNSSVRAVLQDKLLSKAEVGICIARLGSSEDQAVILFRHNSDIPLIPASNLKVVTTAAALDRLGENFRFRTLLVQQGQDLHLWGDGDPTLGDVEMLRKAGWGTTTVFANWAEQLKRRGITSVGNVIVDDSVFDEQFLHSNWPEDQVHKRYVAQVGGVNLNANCIDFQIRANGPGQIVGYQMDPPTQYAPVKNTCVAGNDNAIWLSRAGGSNEIVLRGEARRGTEAPVSVTIHDPPMFAATVLAETLRSAGIQVTGVVQRDRTSRSRFTAAGEEKRRTWQTVGIHETPLATVLSRANKDSMNLYAEALCKRLGRAVFQQPGSWQNGTAATGQFLAGIGVPASEFRLDDGSGLSKQNAISAQAIVRVLIHQFASQDAQIFVASMAVAGSDGTLEERFRGTDLIGRVHAKSGFVSGVSCLSGYLQGRDGTWYAFSIMMNGIPGGSNSSIKPLQEKIVRAIEN